MYNVLSDSSHSVTGGFVGSISSIAARHTDEGTTGKGVLNVWETCNARSTFQVLFSLRICSGWTRLSWRQLDTASPLMASDLSDSMLDQITPF